MIRWLVTKRVMLFSLSFFVLLGFQFMKSTTDRFGSYDEGSAVFVGGQMSDSFNRLLNLWDKEYVAREMSSDQMNLLPLNLSWQELGHHYNLWNLDSK